MLNDPDPIAPGDVEPDPATPARRIRMARALLLGAIRRYEATLAATRRMAVVYPDLGGCRPPMDAAGLAEHRAWRRLLDQVDDDFDNAELALAARIQALYDDLAPEGRKLGPGPHRDFIERAVRYRGTSYALQYDVARYEPSTNIIALVREPRAFDLDREGTAGDA